MSKKFKRKIEDFVCENCKAKVKGNGYTDHCPKCLWSKHVDINPGDREANCDGLMQPISAEKKSEEYIIHYKCLKCNYKHSVKSSPDDDFEKILNLM